MFELFVCSLAMVLCVVCSVVDIKHHNYSSAVLFLVLAVINAVPIIKYSRNWGKNRNK